MSIVGTLERRAAVGTAGRVQHLAPAKPSQTVWYERSAAAQDKKSAATARREREQEVEAQAIVELRKSAYHPVRHVLCEVCKCVLILRGRVPSYYMKQIAQTVVRHLLESGMVLDNQLEVDGT